MSDPAPASRPAPRLRSIRALRQWLQGSRWRVVFFFGGCLLTLGVLAIAEENWRAERAWNRCRQTLAAAGEKLTLADFKPQPLPPEQNFAATPLLAPPPAARLTNAAPPPFLIDIALGTAPTAQPGPTLGNWRAARRTDLQVWAEAYRSRTNLPAGTDSAAAAVLATLARFEPEFAELRAASLRPYAQFPWTWNQPDQLAPHFQAAKAITQALALHAIAGLAEGRTDAALADVTVSLKLDQALRNEPVMLAYMVRVALLQVTLLPVWEGLAEHRWSDAQLQTFQRQFGQLDLLADLVQTRRGERGLANTLTEQMLTSPPAPAPGGEPATVRAVARDLGFGPRALLRQNQIHINELFQLAIDALQTAASGHEGHRPPNLVAFQARAQSLRTQHPYRALAGLLGPALQSVIEKGIQAQASLDLAVVACALERHRLAHGTYPAQLPALVPDYLARLPLDLADGQPLRYRRDPDGQFVLYSLGLNGQDDGGRVEMISATHNPDPHQGDWVWRYPPTAPASVPPSGHQP